MSLTADLRNLLEEAHNRRIEPIPVPAKKSQAMRLELDERKVTLISAQGNPTAAGKYWYRKLKGAAVPDSRWDDNAKTYRKPGGRTDFVKTRSGAEVQLRTWEPATKTFKYTALGKKILQETPKNVCSPSSCDDLRQKEERGRGMVRRNLPSKRYEPSDP